MSYPLLKETDYEKLEELYKSYLGPVREKLEKDNDIYLFDVSEGEEDFKSELDLKLEIHAFEKDDIDASFAKTLSDKDMNIDDMVTVNIPYIPYRVLCELSIDQIQELIKVTKG